MQYRPNPNKSLARLVEGKTYYRHAIKTRYVRPGDDYIEVMRTYALPLYRPHDILSISEKIIALCQNRVIYKKDIKLSFWAKFLCRFVNITPAGEAVGNPYKMQIAIMLCGLPKVLFAAFCAGVGKLFKKRGVFYKIVGPEVIGLDGFADDAFDDYLEMGILIPLNPDGVCDEILEKLGMSCIIVDANDLNVEVLGRSSDIPYDKITLCEMIKDNPAGQANQQTPLILIHEAQEGDEVFEEGGETAAPAQTAPDAGAPAPQDGAAAEEDAAMPQGAEPLPEHMAATSAEPSAGQAERAAEDKPDPDDAVDAETA